MKQAILTVWSDPRSRAVALVFAFVSSLYGTWLTRIPEVQAALGLSEAELGWALLGMPIGMLGIMPFSGWLIARWGAGRTTVVSALAFAAVLSAPAWARSGVSLGVALGLIGLADGLLNVAMNARANAVEEDRGASIMSTCHGFFSVGGIVGAGVGSATAALDVSLELTLGAISLLGALLVIRYRRALTSGPSRTSVGPVVALPTPALLGVGALVFCVLLSEGAVSTWSAVYLRNGTGASPGVAGLGYAAFSFTMALGRFYGDPIVEHVGRTRVVQVGAGAAGLGLLVAAAVAHPAAAIAGFAVMGLGYAALIPVLFRAAAQTPGLAPGTSLAAVAGIGYVGLFLGPPALGVLADWAGLAWIVISLGVLSLLVAAFAAPVLHEKTPAG